MGLDFKNEQLVYDPYHGMKYCDLGTKVSLEQIIGLLKFRRDLFGNGQLQIKSATDHKILGFTKAFIPVNIDPGRTMKNFDAAISEAEQELENR